MASTFKSFIKHKLLAVHEKLDIEYSGGYLKLGLLLTYHIHKLLSYISYCQDSFCAMPVVI